MGTQVTPAAERGGSGGGHAGPVRLADRAGTAVFQPSSARLLAPNPTAGREPHRCQGQLCRLFLPLSLGPHAHCSPQRPIDSVRSPLPRNPAEWTFPPLR